MYRIYKKILNSDQGDFKRWYVLEEILWLFSQSQVPEDQGVFTCMQTVRVPYSS